MCTPVIKILSITKINETAGIPALPAFIQQQNDNFFRKLSTLPEHLPAIENLEVKQVYQGSKQRVRLANAPSSSDETPPRSPQHSTAEDASASNAEALFFGPDGWSRRAPSPPPILLFGAEGWRPPAPLC